MSEKGVFLCPTLRVFEMMKKQPLMPKGIREGLYEVSVLFTTKLAKRRVKLLVGQDGADPEGTLEEMKLMKACGVPEAATWLGVQDRLGAVAPNMEADLVILDRDPLEEIGNMEAVFMVVQRGKIVKP